MNDFEKRLKRISTEALAEEIVKVSKLQWKQFNPKIRQKLGFIVNEFLSREEIHTENYELIFNTLVEHGVNHPDILHFYIKCFLGFDIPRRRFCREHTSPFKLICDLFFEQVRNAIAFANRTGGKTLATAILNHLDMTFKPGCEIASCGATKDQASKCYRYFTDFHNRNAYLAELLLKDPTRNSSVYTNGSILEVITGSIKGLNAPHPNKARIDEVELMDWEVLQEGLSMSVTGRSEVTGKPIMAQNVFSCITAETLILTDLGYIRVDDLLKEFEQGRKAKVKTFDFEQGKFTFNKITNIWQSKREDVLTLEYLINKYDDKYLTETIRATADHLFCNIYFHFGNGGCKYQWVELEDLLPGDLLLANDTIAIVKEIKKDKLEDVFDIEVEKNHNFIANNLVIHNSTRKYEAGTFQRLLDKAKSDKRVKGGFRIYSWCIWDILQQCTRKCQGDRSYGDCVIYEVCQGRAHNCSGFYYIDDFIDKASTLDKDTLDAQWFNKKPSSQLYVYGDFWEVDAHRISRIDLSGRFVIPIGAIDFGASPGHPFVYKEYLCDVTNFKKAVEELSDPNEIVKEKIKIYISYEYRSGEATIDQHSRRIKNAPNYYNGMPIFADPSAKQERVDLEETYGILTEPAINAIESGIDGVRRHLQKMGGGPYLFYFEDYYDGDPKLDDSIEEYRKYKYRKTPDGRPNKKSPEQINDHGMDCDRYVINSIYPYFRELFTPEEEEIEEDGYWFS